MANWQILHKHSSSQRAGVLIFTVVLLIGVFAMMTLAVNVALMATSSRQQEASAEYVAQAALAALISAREQAMNPNSQGGNANIFRCNHNTESNDHSDGRENSASRCNRNSTAALTNAITAANNAATNVAAANRSTLARAAYSLSGNWRSFGYCDFTGGYLVNNCNWIEGTGEPTLGMNPNAADHIQRVNAIRVIIPSQEQKLRFSFLGTSTANLKGGRATVVYDPRRTTTTSNPSLDSNNISTKSFILIER